MLAVRLLRGLASSSSNTYTNTTPLLGSNQPSKPTVTEGAGTLSGERTRREGCELAMEPTTLTCRIPDPPYQNSASKPFVGWEMSRYSRRPCRWTSVR